MANSNRITLIDGVDTVEQFNDMVWVGLTSNGVEVPLVMSRSVLLQLAKATRGEFHRQPKGAEIIPLQAG